MPATHRIARSGVALLTVLMWLPRPTMGQSVAPAYLHRYREIMQMEPDRERVAKVSQFTLRRDVMEIVLEEGTLALLTPVDGRIIGAVFTGRGRFRYRPSIQIERDRLRRFEKKEALDDPFIDAVLFFTDSTAAELEHTLEFGPGKVPGALRERVTRALSYLGDSDRQMLYPDLLAPLLNGEAPGFFYAWLSGSGSPWIAMINPAEIESVHLLTQARRQSWVRTPESVTQHRPAADSASRQLAGDRRPGLFVQRYDLKIHLSHAFSGSLSYSADAELELGSDTTVGPWNPLWMYPKLELDSATAENGTPLTVFKSKDSWHFWVNLVRPLARGETRRIRLFYHGNLVERHADLFYVPWSVGWYPSALESRHPGTFDVTFTYPSNMTLVSVGDRVDSAAVTDRMTRTRWVTPRPIRYASFDIGDFDVYTMAPDSLPPVTVLWSERTHRTVDARKLRRGLTDVPRGKDMGREVGQDLVAAMEFYSWAFGPAPVTRFYASEIPAGHGEALPGMIKLGWWTFDRNAGTGIDQFFHGHEVAHQWWGISVDHATYRDQWLSEGFADFSALWFLENRLGQGGAKIYAGLLDRWQSSILRRRGDYSSIGLGRRVSTAATEDDHHAIVYEKGAWVLHMLRMYLLNLRTMQDDRFLSVMRAFYQRYAGGLASTDDFRAVVEEQTGEPMDWFFDQWVYGSDIPTYRVASKIETGSNGRFIVRLRVDQERVPPSFLAYVPVRVEMEGSRVVRTRVKVSGARTEVVLPPTAEKPRKIIFNDLQAVLAEVKEVGW